jgi:plastocyanin
VLAVTVAAIALAAPGAAPTTASVRIDDFAFTPATVRIRRNGRVTWRFRDAVRHDVTSTGTRRFRRIPARRTGNVSRRFRRTGTYRYICRIHPNMTGRVVVTRR